MRVLSLSILLILSSCALNPTNKKVNRLKAQGTTTEYQYQDASGELFLKLEQRVVGNNFVTRRQLFNHRSDNLPLESNTSVAKVQKDGRLIPFLSDFKVWYESKEYQSQIRVELKNATAYLKVKSPVAKLNGSFKVKLKRKGPLCFFSQLADCLLSHRVLNSNEISTVTVLWDSYPFQQMQYNEVPQLITLQGKVEPVNTGRKKSFNLNFPNQVLNLHLNQDGEVARFYWVAEGISYKKRN